MGIVIEPASTAMSDSTKPGWWRRLWTPEPPPSDIDRARALIRAVDAGGVPLNPARINAIARGLGLEVSGRAQVSETIARIRAAMERVDR